LPHVLSSRPEAAGETGQHPQQWVTESAFSVLRGQALSSSCAQQVLVGCAALPAEAYVFQMGAMLSRHTAGVRLCIRNMSPPHLVNYLTGLGWSGQPQALCRTLNALATLVDRIDLDVDIDQTVSPKIGLECYIQPHPQDRLRWQSLLAYLHEVGLCVPAKRDTLLDYPGYVDALSHPDVWPQHLKIAAAFVGQRAVSLFTRGLHHIKVVFQEDRAQEAKAYLSVRHAWYPVAAAAIAEAPHARL
jgi:hypothetical protein